MSPSQPGLQRLSQLGPKSEPTSLVRARVNDKRSPAQLHIADLFPLFENAPSRFRIFEFGNDPRSPPSRSS